MLIVRIYVQCGRRLQQRNEPAQRFARNCGASRALGRAVRICFEIGNAVEGVQYYGSAAGIGVRGAESVQTKGGPVPSFVSLRYAVDAQRGEQRTFGVRESWSGACEIHAARILASASVRHECGEKHFAGMAVPYGKPFYTRVHGHVGKKTITRLEPFFKACSHSFGCSPGACTRIERRFFEKQSSNAVTYRAKPVDRSARCGSFQRVYHLSMQAAASR